MGFWEKIKENWTVILSIQRKQGNGVVGQEGSEDFRRLAHWEGEAGASL